MMSATRFSLRPRTGAWPRRVTCGLVVLAMALSGCSEDEQDPYVAPDERVVAAIASDALLAGFGDPDEVELPPVEDRTATTAWLTGEGAAAVGLFTQAAQLWASDEPDCIAIAESLDQLGTPTEVRAAVLSTPDPVTRDLLLSVDVGVVDLLASCDPAQPALDLRSSEHAWQWTIANRRLEDLGVLPS